jgi:CheY-like chemotaxis protein/DNA-binding XRE family transcriptional regulator
MVLAVNAQMDVKKQFGTSIRSWRNRLGISQEELAGRAGLHRTYVCDVERGARNVSLESIQKLARALELTMSQVFMPPPQTLSVSEESAKSGLMSGEAMVDILFVEDRAEDVELALDGLKRAYFTNRIHVVRDGAEALEYLHGPDKGGAGMPRSRPHLILLDLGLPKIDGLEVLRRVKADERTRSIPVVVLTASRQDRDIAMSKRLGAEAYLVKPVQLQNLSEITPQLSLQWALLRPMPVMTS